MSAAVSEVYETIEGNTFQDKIQACKHIILYFCADFSAILRTRLKRKRKLYTQSELPFLLSFQRLGIDVRTSAV